MKSLNTKLLSSLIISAAISNSAIAQESKKLWWENVTPTALIEIEAFVADPPNGPSESDIVVATVEFGATAQITKQLTAEITLLYEEDETDLEVDVATLNYAFEGSTLSLLAGQAYLPFGVFESSFISDPLTLEIGETRETTVSVTHEANGFSGVFYAFNGDVNENQRNQINGFGVNANYKTDIFSIGLSYISAIGDSDTLQDALSSTDVNDQTAGLALDTLASFGNVTLIVEYVTALDEFDDAALVDTKPSATNLEINYSLRLANKPATLAFAYQTTGESLALELPETRLLAGLSLELSDNIGLGFELVFDEDYDDNEGGTGDSTTVFNVQFAAQF